MKLRIILFNIQHRFWTHHILTFQIFERDSVRQVGMQKGAECHSIVPTAAEVCDVDALENNQIFYIWKIIWPNISTLPMKNYFFQS